MILFFLCCVVINAICLTLELVYFHEPGWIALMAFATGWNAACLLWELGRKDPLHLN